GPFDRVQVVDLCALREPDVPAQEEPGDLELHEPVERIKVRLRVLAEVAHVLPVAVRDVAEERPSHLQEQGEELLGEIVRLAGGDMAEDLRLEHVDPRVDRVREDLTPGGLFEEPLYPSVVVGDDDAELQGVLDRLEPDRHGRLALLVEGDQRTEVDVAE